MRGTVLGLAFFDFHRKDIDLSSLSLPKKRKSKIK